LIKLRMTLQRAACLGTLSLLVSGAGGAFADEALISYLPAVQSRPAAPEDPVKAQRRADRKAARVQNRRLAANVRKSLGAGGGVDMSRVSVVARSGSVTLAGTVPDAAQIDLAQQRAQQVAGVTTVSNSLNLRSEGGR